MFGSTIWYIFKKKNITIVNLLHAKTNTNGYFYKKIINCENKMQLRISLEVKRCYKSKNYPNTAWNLKLKCLFEFTVPYQML